MYHPGAAENIAVGDGTDVVDLALQRHAAWGAVEQTVAGLAHGRVDQRKQRAAVQLAMQVAQAVMHAQAQQRLALFRFDDFQAEQAPEGAASADCFFLHAHTYFLRVLALANSAAMPGLAGAGLSWLE